MKWSPDEEAVFLHPWFLHLPCTLGETWETSVGTRKEVFCQICPKAFFSCQLFICPFTPQLFLQNLLCIKHGSRHRR